MCFRPCPVNSRVSTLFAAFLLSLCCLQPASKRGADDPLGLLAAGARPDYLRPFSQTSLAAIKAEYAGQSFMLSLWSTDCPPCREELVLFGELRKINPDLPLVLVSTDAPAQHARVASILAAAGLAAHSQSWIFTDGMVERLRYSIDPQWYGELPRSYYFAAGQQVAVHSGVLSRGLLETYLGLASGR